MEDTNLTIMLYKWKLITNRSREKLKHLKIGQRKNNETDKDLNKNIIKKT